jgi:iron complex transport system substrate-binding protein
MRSAVVVLAAAALALTGCASSAEPGSENAPTPRAEQGFPVTVEAANGPVDIPRRPERIVSLSPTGTEMLFAVGAGDQVVAVDDNSTYPPEAPVTDLSGFEPNVEAVAGYDPDLVVLSDDAGDIVGSLAALGIAVLHQPAAADLNDTYRQLIALGQATGHPDGASEVILAMRSRIAELAAGAPRFDRPPTYYHELDDTFFTVASDTFIGGVYELLGLENIADRADPEGTGYPQLSAEYIVQADPELIFLADTVCCNQSAETVAERPGWDRITAVRIGGVVPLNDDIASRWGPRIVDLVETVSAELERLAPALDRAA